MKLPSLTAITSGAAKTILRFPLAFIAAELATAASLILINHEGPARPTLLFPVLFACTCGVGVFTAVTVAAEYRDWNKVTTGLLMFGSLIALGFYGWNVPRALTGGPEIHYNRFQMLLVAAILMVSWAPFAFRKNRKNLTDEFWEFNIRIAGRVILGFLGTLALWGGLSLALAAIDNLFALKINPKRYGELGVAIVGVCNTLFVLSGIPTRRTDSHRPDGDDVEPARWVPTPVRWLSLYVLVPVIIVYGVVLVAYAMKMLVTWRWLSGWVGPLAMGFSAVGVMTLLLLEPIRSAGTPRWVGKFVDLLNASLIPVGILLILAVQKRMAMFGLTEMRLIGVLIAIWVIGVSIAGLLKWRWSSIIIPFTVCSMALAAAVGPWSIFSLSEGSQTGRLYRMFADLGMIENGKVRKPANPVARELILKLQYQMDFIGRSYGYHGITSWFDVPLIDSSGLTDRPILAYKILAAYGIEIPDDPYVRRYSPSMGVDEEDIHTVQPSEMSVNIHGYDLMSREIRASVDRSPSNGREEDIRWVVTDSLRRVSFMDMRTHREVQVPLEGFLRRLARESGHKITLVAPDSLSVSVPWKSGQLRMDFSEVRLKFKPGLDSVESAIPVSFSFRILYNN